MESRYGLFLKEEEYMKLPKPFRNAFSKGNSAAESEALMLQDSNHPYIQAELTKAKERVARLTQRFLTQASNHHEIENELKKEAPQFQFRRVSPTCAQNALGDKLVSSHDPSFLKYIKLDGRELTWTIDFGFEKDLWFAIIRLPKNPGWEGSAPFSPEELERIKDEVRYGAYLLDFEAVVFYEFEYVEHLNSWNSPEKRMELFDA